MAYIVEFAECVKEHFKSLTTYERTVILNSIHTQLVYEPLTETRNRKLLRPNPIAPWELRIGDLRAFYEIVAEEPNIVRVLAVGRKKGNQLFIGRKVVIL
ncbi:MAG: type II toxin-antitoxin system RelE/ParE family toxin [bacterium]|nr:type II toxin-antitoxin system RelE/ParE family toxin [bacterium]